MTVNRAEISRVNTSHRMTGFWRGLREFFKQIAAGADTAAASKFHPQKTQTSDLRPRQRRPRNLRPLECCFFFFN